MALCSVIAPEGALGLIGLASSFHRFKIACRLDLKCDTKKYLKRENIAFLYASISSFKQHYFERAIPFRFI